MALLHTRAALVLLAGVARAQTFSCTADNTTRWRASDDARQNAANATGHSVEWWFFTAFSPAADLGLAMTYHPTRGPQAGIHVMVYEHAATPASSRVTSHHRLFDVSTVSSSNASQSYGTDHTTSLEVVDERTYVLRGAIPASDLNWTLTYRQQVDAARENVDVLGVVALDWIAYMPSATVVGVLSYQGKEYTISDGVGYHDHNSGKWPKSNHGAHVSPDSSNVDVAAVNGKGSKLAFDYKWGSIYGGTSGIGGVYGGYLLPGPLAKYSVDYVFVRAHGRRIEFATLCGHKVSIEPLALANRPGGYREATSVRLTAENADWRVEWVHAVRSSAVNEGGTGLGLVVYEQLSMHNLTLTAKRRVGDAYTIDATFAELRDAPGFTEWSNPL